jgi:tRNA threonylcarbamoyladenosine biosynthesis protein TsaB
MNILALDTSTEHASIALAKGEETWLGRCESGTKTSATIVPLCLEGLKTLSLSLAKLDAIVYTKGPGAFTGLRTAVSLAQGFSLAHGTPTLGFSTLQCLAQTARLLGHAQERVVCALDARMQQVYWGAYQWQQNHWVCVQAPRIESESALSWPAPWGDLTSTAATLMAGNAKAVKELVARGPSFAAAGAGPALGMGEGMGEGGADMSALTGCDCEPSAQALLALAQQHFAYCPALDGPKLVDPVHLGLPSPWYLRDQVAQTTLERAAAQAASMTQTSTPKRA